MKKFCTSIAAVLVVGLGASVAAQGATPSPLEAPKVRVAYGDLDIHGTNGAKTLYARLQRASELACEVKSYRETGSLKRFREAKVCYASLLDDLVSQIDSDALQRIHSS